MQWQDPEVVEAGWGLRFEDVKWLALKLEEEAMSQGIQVTS